MQYDFERLLSKKIRNITPGLERVRSGYEALGQPCSGRTNILVGGTNGKGGMTGFLYALFAQSTPTGLFTSPHLVSFEECFQISHRSVSEDDLTDIWKHIHSRIEEKIYEDLSFFECATLMSFSLFERNRTKINVIEVGLGGLNDATNVIEPSVSCITSVSRDHEAFLGSSLSSILKEKLGITRPSSTLFWGHSGEVIHDDAALTVLNSYISEHKLCMRGFGKDFWIQEGGHTFCLRQGTRTQTFEVPLGLRGKAPFIVRNFVTACAIYEWTRCSSCPELPRLGEAMDLLGRSDLMVPPSMIGRFQPISVSGTSIVLDVCHNPNGMDELIKAIDQKKFMMPCALMSIFKDKRCDEMLDQAKGFFSHIELFSVDHERSFCRDDLDSRHHDLVFHPNFVTAWESANKWGSTKEPIFICGSVGALGVVLKYFEIGLNTFTFEKFMK